MPQTKPAYPPEFRRKAIRLLRASGEEHPISGIAREIGLSDGTLRNRANQEAPRRGRHRSFDGKDRNRPGQSAITESFIATLKIELSCIDGVSPIER